MKGSGRMKSRGTLAAFMGLALAAMAGCSTQQNQQVRQDVKGVRKERGEAADAAQKKAADATLAAKVKAALATRKGLAARAIHVEAKGSTVTLKGDVASPEQAALAKKVAMETQGVATVEDRLTM